MGQGRRAALTGALALLAVAGARPGPAAAAACADRGPLHPVAPATAGLDPDGVARAVHAFQDRRGYLVRIYRDGCLVGRDTNVGSERARYETWGITSSVLALLAGREMALGLLSPDDPVGALVPEADAAHGAIRVRDLLARTTGLAARPDDIYINDRLRAALTAPFGPADGAVDAPIGTALLAEVLTRAAGEDLESFAARELFGPLGIAGWRWTRDAAGLPGSTFGLALTGDGAALLAELVRQGGVWNGRRLLDASFLDALLRPGAENPCLGWLTWVNAGTRCGGVGERLLPGLPADLWEWRGRGDQRVIVLPSLGLVVVRFGTTASDARSSVDARTWERDALDLLLGAVRDRAPQRTAGADDVPPAAGDTFADDPLSLLAAPPALPPAGPARARAPQVTPLPGRRPAIRIACPPVSVGACTGTAQLTEARGAPRAWSAAPGTATVLRFRIGRRTVRTASVLTAHVVAGDAAGGEAVEVSLPRPAYRAPASRRSRARSA